VVERKIIKKTVTSLANASNDEIPGKKLTANFPEELPLCCAVLISAATYTCLH